MKSVRKVLYRLPKVIQANEVCFVEGEKCVDAAESLGLVATTLQGGADSPWIAEYTKALRGKRVILIPDNDEPGRKLMTKAAEALKDVVASIKWLELPDLSPKGDLADWVKKFSDSTEAGERLSILIENAEPWQPPRVFFSAKDLINTSFKKHRPIIEKGILPHGGHILIAGETGVGKSLLRMELSLHLVMGWPWMGFDIPSAQKVAIFQYENPESTEQVRLSHMCEGLGINLRKLPDDRMVYADRKTRVNLSLKGDRAKLLEMVKESGAEVIFYDCLSNLHAGDENKNMALREVVDVLTDINAEAGTACVLIHHFGKGGNQDARKIDRIRGASSLVDWAMTAITFTVRPHENRIVRQLDFVKVRDGAIPKPVLCERDENFLLSITDEDSLCPPGKIRELLQELGGSIESQKPLLDAIMSDTGCSDKSARKYIRRAVESEFINELDPGRGKRKSYQISD